VEHWRFFYARDEAMPDYAKPALPVNQLIDLLVHRGMHIPDRAEAAHYLAHISYYRLRAYWLPFEAAPANGKDHAFVAGTNFSTILAIYDFDRELRLLLIDAIERIEISLCTRLASEIGLQYGPFAHEDPRHFAKRERWQHCHDELIKEYNRSRETFAEHYRTRYPHLHSPPLWVACELMTLGHLSHWLQNLRIPKDRQIIANAYNLDERVLASFTHHLTIVRNHCAHHGRVWNRKLSLKMAIPDKKPAGLGPCFNKEQDRLIYNTLAMLAHLMRIISPASTWRERLKQLIHVSPQIDVSLMGFPTGWEQLYVWQ
jgi:abortive infection bacteriophage resistance protein